MEGIIILSVASCYWLTRESSWFCNLLKVFLFQQKIFLEQAKFLINHMFMYILQHFNFDLTEPWMFPILTSDSEGLREGFRMSYSRQDFGGINQSWYTWFPVEAHTQSW